MHKVHTCSAHMYTLLPSHCYRCAGGMGDRSSHISMRIEVGGRTRLHLKQTNLRTSLPNNWNTCTSYTYTDAHTRTCTPRIPADRAAARPQHNHSIPAARPQHTRARPQHTCSTGSRTTTAVPRPTPSLCTLILPLWALTSSFAMDRPNPTPPKRRVAVMSACTHMRV